MVMLMAILLSLSPKPPKTHQNPNRNLKPTTLKPIPLSTLNSSRRYFILNSTSLCFLSSTLIFRLPISIAETLPSKSILSGIASTKSWSQFYGNGFAIRVPPQFEDMTEPEDYNAGLSLYGDKAKTKTFAAQFASPDRSEVVTILIRPSNQLKITFLELMPPKIFPYNDPGYNFKKLAKDITNLGTLKEAAKIFVPGGSTIYSARTIKIKEDESFKTYYFYEFGRDGQHVALVAAVNSGKAIVAAASAPESKWEDDGVKLRSAALENIVNSTVNALVQCVDEMKKSGAPFLQILG